MKVSRLQLAFSLLLSAIVVVIIVLNFQSILESLKLAANARPEWIAIAFGLELLGFFIASQVYRISLRSLGYHGFSPLRLWAVAMIAIVTSQSFPAGAVASYAFLLHSFRKRGVTSAHSALVATLEALSYATAMIVLFAFSLFFIGTRGQYGQAETNSLVAAIVGVVVIAIVVFVLTREESLLLRWAMGVKRLASQVSRHSIADASVNKAIGELIRGRDMISARWLNVLALIGIQLTALTVHSLALMAVLYSLDAHASLPVVLAAFGVALVSSTFNVLPGGGGTVEAAIALTLTGLGVGPQAIPATIIFRLLNYWCMVPIALVSYRLLMRGATPVLPDEPSEEAERVGDTERGRHGTGETRSGGDKVVS